METKPDIEDLINKALNAIKNIEPVELPFGFSDRVMNKLHAQPTKVRSMYSISPLLKIAAVFILILINVITLKLALSPQPSSTAAQFVTIKDFVNGYQINDANEELVTINTPKHEQP